MRHNDNFSWRKIQGKQSCTDLNLKISSTKAALMKIGAIIKPNKIMKPYFNEKGSGSEKIALSGNESVLTGEKEIAYTMNNDSINITKH